MKDLEHMYTPSEIEALIEEIERNIPGLRAKATSQRWTLVAREADPKLGAMCKALERLEQLREEIRIGLRDEDGNLNVSV